MMQIFDKENAFLDWQKDKELVEFEYKYIYNITNMIKNCIKKYDSVKIIGNDFYYIKHNYNLKKIIENFNKDNVDELYILNIIVNFLFDKINTLDIQKNLILSQDKEIIGYSYNKDNNQILNVYKKITKKNKSLINDSRIHMIRCHQY